VTEEAKAVARSANVLNESFRSWEVLNDSFKTPPRPAAEPGEGLL
jgi:hypothetical protein